MNKKRKNLGGRPSIVRGQWEHVRADSETKEILRSMAELVEQTRPDNAPPMPMARILDSAVKAYSLVLRGKAEYVTNETLALADQVREAIGKEPRHLRVANGFPDEEGPPSRSLVFKAALLAMWLVVTGKVHPPMTHEEVTDRETGLINATVLRTLTELGYSYKPSVKPGYWRRDSGHRGRRPAHLRLRQGRC